MDTDPKDLDVQTKAVNLTETGFIIRFLVHPASGQTKNAENNLSHGGVLLFSLLSAWSNPGSAEAGKSEGYVLNNKIFWFNP